MRRWLPIAALLFGLGRLAMAAEGQVVDAISHQPIGKATVVAEDRRVLTDAEGRFRLDDGHGPVFFRAPGYRAATFEAAPEGEIALEPLEPKAIYLTVYGIGSHSLRENALSLIARSDLNALVVDIKGDRGQLPYPSRMDLAESGGSRKLTTIPDLPGLVRMLQERRIYTIARIVSFKDPTLAAARPDLAVHLADGELFRDREGLAWTDPHQPEVRAYLIGVAEEAAQAGFDEIQFDYVRFPDAPEKLVFAGPAHERARLAAISAFLAEARDRLTRYNVYLSADIFGYVCWNLDDTGIGQRLEEMAPFVDYFLPMLYPSGFQFGIPGYPNPVDHPYQVVRLSLEQARERLGISPKRFRPWLQAFKDYAFDRRMFDAEEVKLQVRAAEDFGSDGWMLWNPRNLYDQTGLGECCDPASEPCASPSCP